MQCLSSDLSCHLLVYLCKNYSTSNQAVNTFQTYLARHNQNNVKHKRAACFRLYFLKYFLLIQDIVENSALHDCAAWEKLGLSFWFSFISFVNS